MPEVSCKAVAVQNSSQWPRSMCPFPHFSLVGVRTSRIFNIFWTPWALDPITNPYLRGGGALAGSSYRSTSACCESSWYGISAWEQNIFSQNKHWVQFGMIIIIQTKNHGPFYPAHVCTVLLLCSRKTFTGNVWWNGRYARLALQSFRPSVA